MIVSQVLYFLVELQPLLLDVLYWKDTRNPTFKGIFEELQQHTTLKQELVVDTVWLSILGACAVCWVGVLLTNEFLQR